MEAFQEFYWFSTIIEYFKIARVESWLGWIFSFGFGSIFLSLPSLERFLVILVAFSLATASIFILNQYFDRKGDQKNTFKSSLPVASGRIAPRTALILSLSLMILCLVLVIPVDINLLSLFIIYLGLGIAYSAPPFRLKTVPVVDFAISGVGAGFIPFLMGLELTGKLSSNMPSILLGVAPLILFHCGGHIIQAIGDYEADRKMGIHTFAVTCGREKSAIIAGLTFLLAGLSPLIYLAFGLLSYTHLFVVFALFPLSIPIIKRYTDVLKEPSAKNVVNMQKTATKCGIIGITVILGYTLLMKLVGF